MRGPATADAGFADWIHRQQSLSARRLAACISATGLATERTGFGQRIVPRPGSVLACPIPAHYDPDPDYFFHWLRDSALVVDALRVAIEMGSLPHGASQLFAEFVGFSLELDGLDGLALLARGDPLASVQPAFRQYVRPRGELAAVAPASVPGEARFNADGTLDIIRWSRPQHDGPALRALALFRWSERGLVEDALRADIDRLLRADLAYVRRTWREPGFDLWEEHFGPSYYARLVQRSALLAGAAWLEERGDGRRAALDRADAAALETELDLMWLGSEGYYASRADAAGVADPRLDGAVLLAVLHAGLGEGRHSILDDRVQATLAAIEAHFEVSYAINQGLPPTRAPALGRYPGDRYYSGGAFYVTTLAAAETYFRLALAVANGATLPRSEANRAFFARLDDASRGDRPVVEQLLAKGDAFLATVRAHAPESGELAEQFDQRTGIPSSAKDLAWSHAAFLTACHARSAAQQARCRCSGPKLPRGGGQEGSSAV